ncbi:MAG: hypothetical protein U0136_11645 [Bdellovibrionota bacterium]
MPVPAPVPTPQENAPKPSASPNSAPGTVQLPTTVRPDAQAPEQAPAAQPAVALPAAQPGPARAQDWNVVIKGDLQTLIRGLSAEHLTPEKFNERAYQVLEKLAQEVPFFKKVLETAKEKGYTFHAVGPDSPKEVQDFFQGSGALAATEKTSNRVYFDFAAIAASYERHKGQQSYGAGIVELLGNEGVHVIEDRLKTEADAREVLGPRRGVQNIVEMTAILERAGKGDKTPTKLETQFRADAVEDYVSTVVGNLAGMTADKDLKKGMSPTSLPSGTLSEEHLVRKLLATFDEAVGQSFPLAGNMDPRSQKQLMGRQIEFVMSGEVERQTTAKLREYGIMDAATEMRPLDVAGVLGRMRK